MAHALPRCRAGRAGATRLVLPAVVPAAAAAALAAPLPAAAAATSDEGELVVSHRLPQRAWAMSLDLRLAPRSSLTLRFGRSAWVTVRRGTTRRVVVEVSGGQRARPRGVRRGRWAGLHVQAHRSVGEPIEVAVGRSVARIRQRSARRLVVRLRRGQGRAGKPFVTPLRDTARLLLHRLADLDARVPPRSFLRGADLRDRLHYANRTWTRGFLAGALWQAGASIRGRDRFERAALRRSRAAFGYELADSHDVGFVYENSSVAAYRRLCRGRRRATARCDELRLSGLEAADTLLELADTNPDAGTIPTSGRRPSPLSADTIIDSMMNLALLYWASGVTGDPSYRNVARRHARRVSGLLVRPDGSTAQSVHFDRGTGRVVRIHTHQGRSAASTWARGQAWAVYGFTTSAAALRDRGLLRTAERAAAWVADHLPASGVPLYDYNAGPGAPEDTSAAVISAAGALRLARLCARWSGACEQPGRWRPLGRRLLRGAFRHVSRSLPLGYLGQQVGVFGGRKSWDDDAEFAYGLRYAVEAVRLAR